MASTASNSLESHQTSSPSSSSSSLSVLASGSISSNEPHRPNPRRYCALKSLIFPPTLNRITKHKFISATIGIDKKGKSWVSGITKGHKSILINSKNGKVLRPCKAMLFLNQHQVLCVFRYADLRNKKSMKKKKKQAIRDEKEKHQIANNLLYRHLHLQITHIIDGNDEHLNKLIYENRELPCGLDKKQLDKIRFFNDGSTFLYPAKEKPNTIFLHEKTSSHSVKPSVYVVGNASKHVFIRYSKRIKKLFVNDQNTEIAIPEALLKAKDIHHKLSANGNILLSVANQGQNIHVINLDTKHVYGPFVSTRLDSRFLDVSFWYEETLVFLEQSSTGTVCFLKLNYEKDDKELKTIIASLEHQPIFHKASFLHNLQNVNEVIFFGITAETKELHTGILTVKADFHPIPSILFSNIIGQYHGKETNSIEIVRTKKMPLINGIMGFGYDSKGKVYVSTETLIFGIEKALQGSKSSNPLLKLARNKIFFKENWAVVLNDRDQFLVCQASTAIDACNELAHTNHSNTYEKDLLTVLQKKTKNHQIGEIKAQNSMIKVTKVYSDGSFEVNDNNFFDFLFVKCNATGGHKVTSVNYTNACFRIPSSEKIFYFEQGKEIVKEGKNLMHTKRSIQVFLNEQLLEGLSRHMPADYHLVEVNESGTKVVAVINDGHFYKLFVHDLETDRHWYVDRVLADYIDSIHFLDDQTLLFLFEKNKKSMSERFNDAKKGPTKQPPSCQRKYLGIVSVASPDFQWQDCKPFSKIPKKFSCSKFVLIRKHEKKVSDDPLTKVEPFAESYYFGYCYISPFSEHISIFLGELRVRKSVRTCLLSFYK